MEWRPRMVVLDLDGTVVPAVDGRPPAPTPAVRAAVAGVIAAGVPVVVATGRSSWGALDIVGQLGLDGVRMVCSNGAVIFDVAARRVLRQVIFDPGPALRALSEALPALGFAAEDGTEGFRTTAAFPRDFPSRYLAEVSIEELASRRTTRLLCRSREYGTGIVTEVAARVLPGTGTVWYPGRSGFLDVGPAGNTKATGVAAVAGEFGVDAEDVLAIGDDRNDLELFAWAGRSVAMGQAAAEVRAAATYVTDPVRDDGVAVALSRWFEPKG